MHFDTGGLTMKCAASKWLEYQGACPARAATWWGRVPNIIYPLYMAWSPTSCPFFASGSISIEPRAAESQFKGQVWTTRMADGETVSAEALRGRWKSLTIPKDFFASYTKRPAEYITAKDYVRRAYFLDCKNIAFQDKEGMDIWSTEGDGEIDLPAGVGVYIYWGKSKEMEKGKSID